MCHLKAMDNKVQLRQSTRCSKSYPFKKAWSVDIQGAAALDPVGGTVFAFLFLYDVTRHKHGDEVAGGEAPLICLHVRKKEEVFVFMLEKYF